MNGHYAIIQAALDLMPATCRYHGDELEREHGFYGDKSCCDTGKPALARRKAEAALAALGEPEARKVR